MLLQKLAADLGTIATHATNPIAQSVDTAARAKRGRENKSFAISMGGSVAGAVPGASIFAKGVKDLKSHTKASVEHDVKHQMRENVRNIKPKLLSRIIERISGLHKEIPAVKPEFPTKKLIGGAALASIGSMVGHGAAKKYLEHSGDIKKDAGLKEEIAAISTAGALLASGVSHGAKQMEKAEEALTKKVVNNYEKAFEVDSAYLVNDAKDLGIKDSTTDKLLYEWSGNKRLLESKVLSHGPNPEEIEALSNPEGINLYRYNIRHPGDRMMQF